MSGTPTLTTKLLERITTDSALSGSPESVLTGGVYDRELKRSGPGSTPGAFNADGHPRPAAVVTDPDDNADLLGPGGAYQAFPWIYLYAERHASGKAAIANAWDLLFSRLHGWRFATANGTGATVTVIGRLGTRDDEDDDRRTVGGMRLQVVGLWRNT